MSGLNVFNNLTFILPFPYLASPQRISLYRADVKPYLVPLENKLCGNLMSLIPLIFLISLKIPNALDAPNAPHTRNPRNAPNKRGRQRGRRNKRVEA